MKKKNCVRRSLCVAALVLVALMFTSCQALIGDGDITFGYFMGCVIFGIIGIVVGVIVHKKLNYTLDTIETVVMIACSLTPFLWRPIGSFHLLMLGVDVVVSLLLLAIDTWGNDIKTSLHNASPAGKRAEAERQRIAQEQAAKAAEEQRLRAEQEERERAEREAQEAREEAERKAREVEQEAALAARKKAAAAGLSALFPAFLSDEMVKVDADDDAPVNPFFLAKTSVTEELWGLVFPEFEAQHPKRPATGVSFYRAMELCNRLSRAGGLRPCYVIGGATDPDKWPALDASNVDSLSAWDNAECVFDADGFRLPEESEFLYACAGGAANETARFPGGNKLGDVAWCEFNSNGEPHDVATKKPNSLGLYDLNGNVQQWCFDRGDGDTSAAPERLAYGGSFKQADWQNFGRASLSATAAEDDVGLRLCRSVTED